MARDLKNKLVLSSMFRYRDKDGYLMNGLTSKREVDVNGDEIKVENIIGIIGETFITETSQINTIYKSLIYKR